MHKPESVHEKETYKILRDYEIVTNHPILARIPDLVWINKKKRTSDNEEGRKTPGPCLSVEKARKHKK